MIFVVIIPVPQHLRRLVKPSGMQVSILKSFMGSSSIWRPIISQICFQLSTWPMKLARVSGERQLQKWSDTDTEHASPAHSSSTQSIRQLSASAGISLDEHCCCEHFLPAVESLPAVAMKSPISKKGLPLAQAPLANSKKDLFDLCGNLSA